VRGDVLVRHAGDGDGADARDVDHAVAVHHGAVVDVDLAPCANQEFIARADDVVRRDRDVLYRREGRRRGLEQVVAVERQRLAGRLRDEVLEVVAVYALRLGASGFFGARGRLGRCAALGRGLVRY